MTLRPINRSPINPRPGLLATVFVALSASLLAGSSNGAWLHRVDSKSHARPNPLTANQETRDHAAAAGRQLYYNECAKCHGNDGGGLHGRPPVISDRIDQATDGDLFWLMTNGNPWRGMPPWVALPAGERWQLVAYLRALNLDEDAGNRPSAPPREAAPAIPEPHAATPDPQGAKQ